MNDKMLYTVFKQKESHQFYHRWTAKEDLLLSKAVSKYGSHKWTMIANCIPGRTAVQCSTRWFGALNSNIHKGRWSKNEDRILKETVQYYQSITKSSSSILPWSRVAEKIQRRTGVQCQARWTEALDPKIRKGRWSEEENMLLQKAVAQYGCCWIRVSSMIPTRTQRQCRTRWNQMKRLKSMHNDTATHFENDAYQNLLKDIRLPDYSMLDVSQIVNNTLPLKTSYEDVFYVDNILPNNSTTSSPLMFEPFSPLSPPFQPPQPKQNAYDYNAISMQQTNDPMFIFPFMNNFALTSADMNNYLITGQL
ncbi:hypothetical protein G6F56_004756 [Rhizopus delemar]|uniref:Myb-like DNA-binding domain protein n=1 Tax=Rhizopus stolonifer TaxID=4846 RepID=A0A367KK63_RHIST|nr:hypothetical protein G6F56_004756 [Rhizopus delemar]RCI02624.1 Myb-like DNA-binding domain protein [Rhizopus stolonifer]